MAHNILLVLSFPCYSLSSSRFVDIVTLRLLVSLLRVNPGFVAGGRIANRTIERHSDFGKDGRIFFKNNYRIKGIKQCHLCFYPVLEPCYDAAEHKKVLRENQAKPS